MSAKRLAIVTTHPIQYHAPFFRSLAAHPEIDLEVLYCHQATPKEQANAGFGIEFNWDISLLDGYQHRFLKNVADQPTLANFAGLDTPEVKEIVERQHYDAVMVNGWHYKSAWQTMRACWRSRTPVLVRSDSHLHTRRPALKRLGKWPFYRWFISKLDACLPVGTWSRDYFLHYGARPERIFIVPHAIDTDYFSRESAMLLTRREELRGKWGLDPANTVFLFAGKFIEKKRPIDFVRAIGEASKNAPLAGLMVGDGPMRSECEALVENGKLPIRFAGFMNQSEIAQAYTSADALILPSNGGETWGLVVNEAMACGRACFVSDHVGCGPDLILSGETGDVFPMGNVAQLAQLIARNSRDQNALAAMGRKAQRKVLGSTVGCAVDGVVQALSITKTKTKMT